MIGTKMNHTMQAITSFVMARMQTSDRGATAVEYGLIVALIAAVIVGVVTAVGQDVLGGFTDVDNAIP
jgi:pilus assembly protein Flp/PilA